MNRKGVSQWRAGVRFVPAACATAAAIGSGISLKADFFNAASSDIIAMFGLMMVGVLPTMVLSATILRPGAFSVRRLLLYRDALLKQVRLWAGLFVLAFTASLLVVLGKSTDWKLLVPVPMAQGATFNLVHPLNGAIAFVVVLLAMRIFTIFDGIRSLVLLSAEIAVSEAREREKAIAADLQRAVSEVEDSPELGIRVSLPTQPPE